VIVIVWGANWPMLKMVLSDIGPFSFTALRLFGAAVVIGLALAAAGERVLPPPEERMRRAVCGFFQMGAMLGLSLVGLQFVNVGRAAVLAYTMQLWAIPIGVILLGERPSALKLVGGVIGFAGLLLFFNPSLMDWGSGRALFGDGILVAAALSWALGATLYRRWKFTAGYFSQTGWQLLMGSLPLIAVALRIEDVRSIHWSGFLLFFLAFNWLVVIAFDYWCWTRVLNDLSASTAGQVLMLVPILAYFLSVIIFGEAITWDALASVALIVCGIALTFRSVALGALRKSDGTADKRYGSVGLDADVRLP
jgi:drug/metabolite transporter (DMT)-like permease